MIMTRVDPVKLESLAILQREGISPPDIRKAMQISRATYKRYRAEIRRVEREATKLMRAEA